MAMNIARRSSNSARGGPCLVLAATISLGALIWPACQRSDAHPAATAFSAEGQGQKRLVDSEFLQHLPKALRLPVSDDEAAWRVLADYGAVFVARGGAIPPPCVVFPDERAVSEWQSGLNVQRLELDGIAIELQTPAAEALLAARREARAQGLDISPRGRDAARRSYQDTVALWASRVEPGLKHWVGVRRLTKEESDRIRSLPARQQVREILQLEKRGIFFSKDFSKSILYSVAAPGTSQHISMLAFDLTQHAILPVRVLLARHGWYQTVVSDLPHFTFLGVSEDNLPALGLKKVTNSGRTFWIPDLGAKRQSDGSR